MELGLISSCWLRSWAVFGCEYRALVVDCGSKKVDDLVRIVEAEGWTVTRLSFETVSDCDLIGFDAAIISGGPSLFTDPDPEIARQLRENFKWLPSLEMPLLGICLGHQALALDDGAEVFRGLERREIEKIRIEARHALLAGIDSGVAFATDHCEGVSLPPGYVLLASSENYAVEAMANDASGRYGVQFHPEISGKNGERLIANFLRIATLRARPRATPVLTVASFLPMLWFTAIGVPKWFGFSVGDYGWTLFLVPFVGVAVAAGGLLRKERWPNLAVGAILTYLLLGVGACCQGIYFLWEYGSRTP